MCIFKYLLLITEEVWLFFNYFQEFGDSARARKLYEQDSDDDDDDEVEPNPKLEPGKTNNGRESKTLPNMNFHCMMLEFFCTIFIEAIIFLNNLVLSKGLLY